MEGETKSAPEPVSERTPVFRNIAISGVTIHGAKLAIDVKGLPEMPISGLRISDVIASARAGARISYAAMELHNVQMNADQGPAFLAQDAPDLELDDVGARHLAAGMPVIRLDRCPGAIVRNCRALAGTGIFLSVPPGERKSVILEANALGAAKKPVLEEKMDFDKAARSEERVIP